MRFFIPGRLIRFEYLGGKSEQPKSKRQEEENAKYASVQDFAFFAANFGYSKRDYLELTPAERLFLTKAYENKIVADSNLLAAAVANAVSNVLRKKGKRPRKLWRKVSARQGDAKERQQVERIAKKIAAQDGDRWVAMIYAANGMRRRKKKAGEKES